mgnify:CR=1 FL=1
MESIFCCQKFEDDVVFEYHITVKDEEFNLGILTMKAPEGVFEADFDAESKILPIFQEKNVIQ